MSTFRSFQVLMALPVAITLLLWLVRPAVAQDDTCLPIRRELALGMKPDTCLNVVMDTACYVSVDVLAILRTPELQFSAPNDRVQVVELRSIDTRRPHGSVFLAVETPTGPVRIAVFGDAGVNPIGGSVFTMRSKGGKPLCEKTPSGMLVQTPEGQSGQVVVNGVTIKLASTALISMDGALLFDQDPRIERRKGARNPNAPLCSGFDSDCDFGGCSVGERLVWGPFCREDTYSYIEPGLYRVTLFGRGQVEAGATDFNINQDHFLFGSRNLTLPTSYTFCWRGLQVGGTGFETVVKARSSNARVDRLSLEYLGADCEMPWTAPQSDVDLMTVSNVEGVVEVSALGVTRSLGPGEQVRIVLEEGQPVRFGEPLMGGAPSLSPFINWLGSADDGMSTVTIIPPGPSGPSGSGSSGSGSSGSGSSGLQSPQTSPAGLSKEFVLTSLYGSESGFDLQRGKDGEAQASWEGNDQFLVVGELAAIYPFTEDGTQKSFVVTQVNPRDTFVCRQCGVVVGVAIFSREGADWVLDLANLEFDDLGFWGEAFPAEVVQFGPDQYGLLFNTGYGTVDYLAGGYALVAPLYGSISMIFKATTSEYSNFAACENSLPECTDWDSTPLQYRRGAHPNFYDFVIDSQGLRLGAGEKSDHFSERRVYWFVDDIEYVLGYTTTVNTDVGTLAPLVAEPLVRLDVLSDVSSNSSHALGDASGDATAEFIQLLDAWDEIYIDSVTNLQEGRLADVLAGDALAEQLDALQQLTDADCYWLIDVIEPSAIQSIEYASDSEVTAKSVKNWDRDMICNGRRAEMPERDGRFLSTYSIQHLPQGWRIVIKESEKLP